MRKDPSAPLRVTGGVVLRFALDDWWGSGVVLRCAQDGTLPVILSASEESFVLTYKILRLRLRSAQDDSKRYYATLRMTV